MNHVRVLIVDDEPLLRAQLREALKTLWPAAEVVSEAEDGISALREFHEHNPNLVFLDIRMPGLSGIEVAHACAGNAHIVFVTAFDEYAVTAFEEGAVDYVLKPANPVRLAKTITRLKARMRQPPNDMAPIIERLESKETQTPMSWVLATVGRKTHFITLSEIKYFLAEDKYTKVVTRKLTAFIRKPIKELIADLPPDKFWQIHRGTLVAVDYIESINRDGINGMTVTVRDDDTELAVAQNYQHLFRMK